MVRRPYNSLIPGDPNTESEVIIWSRGTTDNRASLWIFELVDTVRKTLLQRAGRLTRPCGKLTLTISAAGMVKEKLLGMLHRLCPAA